MQGQLEVYPNVKAKNRLLHGGKAQVEDSAPGPQGHQSIAAPFDPDYAIAP
jgi:hypothetical protein